MTNKSLPLVDDESNILQALKRLPREVFHNVFRDTRTIVGHFHVNVFFIE